MDSKNSFSFVGSSQGEDQLNDLYDDLLAGFDPIEITRRDFPQDFTFGASSAAYQYEGGATEGGRGLSTWDAFSLTRPARIEDGSNGNVAIWQYKMYKEDVKIIKKTGLDAYRFSISWSRILPGGKLSAGINREGIKYYNDLIDTLLAEGIEPYVTLFHWDLPLSLQHDYGGFLSKKIVKDFHDYAELCFFQFGDRVKHWITTNEAWTYTFKGYVNASFPPCRGSPTPPPLSEGAPRIGYKSSWKAYPAEHGNPGTEPYIVAHNFLLAHAVAVALYRNKFQTYQGGEIGMVNNSNWYEPLDPGNKEDHRAARRAVDFMFGWFVSPLVKGDYPKSMRENVGSRLPVFTPAEAKLVKGSFDFLGVNYYTTYYAANDPKPYPPANPSYVTDQHLISTPFRNGVPIGEKGGSDWLYIVPSGIYELMSFIKTEYYNPPVKITENGLDERNNKDYTVEQAQHDHVRIKYYRSHLHKVKKAMTEGANIKAYFLWSLCDNYEWAEGYTVRFGIYFIDFNNGLLTRYPKRSAIWWANFFSSKPNKRQIQEIEGNEPEKKNYPNDDA